jgi:transcription elongation factor Elf1
MEMRLRQANPNNLDAFFTDLRRIWLESRGRIAEQPATPSLKLSTTLSQKDDFKARLAKDLSYAGIEMDDTTLEKFIYDELKRRLGGTTAHIRKSPFTPRSINATKKVVRKVVPKASAKQTRHCSACGKAGHTKVNCPKGKRTKKVNYVYQDVVEDPEASEEEYIVEEEVVEEEEIEDDDEEYVEYVDENDDEPRNCYASKKKWCEVEYL